MVLILIIVLIAIYYFYSLWTGSAPTTSSDESMLNPVRAQASDQVGVGGTQPIDISIQRHQYVEGHPLPAGMAGNSPRMVPLDKIRVNARSAYIGGATSHGGPLVSLSHVDTQDSDEQHTGVVLTKEGFQTRLNNRRRVVYHYVNWCGYCKRMRPVWDALKTQIPEVEFIENDEDQKKTPGVTSYPTLRMLDEYGNRSEYKGGPDPEAIRRWIMAAIKTSQ